MFNIRLDKKTAEKAKELMLKDGKDLKLASFVDWMYYLEKAEKIVSREEVYENFVKYDER